jgi:epsilon-lactone hydrolase
MPHVPLPLVRAATFGLGKVVLRTQTPVRWQRELTDLLDRMASPPAGVSCTMGRLGGRPALTCAAAAHTEGPVVLHLHGGAYVLGSSRSHGNLGAHLAAACSGTVHVLDYRLAPEHPYPAAEQDTIAAARELLERHGPERLVISGDSGGGGLALITAAALRDAGLPQPRRLVLLSPWVMLDLNHPSRTWKGDLVVGEGWLRSCARAYLAGHAPPAPPDVRGLAPITIQAARDEALVTDALYVAAQARRLGVPIRLTLLDGLWHAPHFLAGLVREVDRLVAELGAELAAELGASITPGLDARRAVTSAAGADPR